MAPISRETVIATPADHGLGGGLAYAAAVDPSFGSGLGLGNFQGGGSSSSANANSLYSAGGLSGFGSGGSSF
ncbi:hypothetical protein PtA15_2A244 [Puccinia triticina]|uniref:Uncharacterized protein n=1 Tax=Puccinia triticina TaxID=208348 RepID=A0ABY7C9R9_9BASI|nr:uncharacterized protein PtA15_2A244 [Puccinia triticina]WAQ81931.1 hypothetical protein PtA15_2A244 [Puccinia triticina]